jgi:hypothetical protein
MMWHTNEIRQVFLQNLSTENKLSILYIYPKKLSLHFDTLNKKKKLYKSSKPGNDFTFFL